MLFVKRNEQAYDAVEEDYFKTIEELSRVAGSLQDPPDPELRERGAVSGIALEDSELEGVSGGCETGAESQPRPAAVKKDKDNSKRPTKK